MRAQDRHAAGLSPAIDHGAAPIQGLIVANHGRHLMVESGGRHVLCHLRGRKATAVVGDQVLWHPTANQGVIDQVLNRRNLLYRQDETRTKSFAANLDLVLVLIAAEPTYSTRQLARALIAAEAAGIDAIIVLNKSDLRQPFSDAWNSLAPYRSMGYPVLPLSLADTDKTGLPNLLGLIRHKTSLILGPSGAGKSSLINQVCPEALAQTSELSRALKSGRHTTTGTTLYRVSGPSGTALIDSPGFQEFGLRHISPRDLPRLMRDIDERAMGCRFHNCTHLHEPGCQVIDSLRLNGGDALDAGRYLIYRELFAELSATVNR